ncbi:MAG TPA: Grx4 family monothiol glutaredoxin [Thermodesulfobacteriota bacterium]|jgi:monothiol glutaredoxin|nr:Grx4 family monothiol glutaredoxin [Thermodesulfobacteriota bacterium]
MAEDIIKKIRSQIENNKILLYMKGTREMPQCGFSARVVEILNSYEVPYETVDVLSDPELRQALKEYSNWPTFPQLYVNGKLIGGCDICVEMDKNGELEPIIRSAVRG